MSKSSISKLAKAISSKRGLDQESAEHFIAKMFEVANTAIQDEKLLKMKWLGTFKVTSVKDRESVDVNTGERIVIEGRDKITFTPDNILKEIVNKPFAQFETVVVNDGVDFADIDEKFSNMQTVESGDDCVEPSKVESEDASEMIPSDISSEKEETIGEQVLESVPESVVEHVVESAVNSKVQDVNEGTIDAHDASEETIEANVGEETKPTQEVFKEEVDKGTLEVREPEEPIADFRETEAKNVALHESDEPTDCNNSHHFVIPKYVVAIVCLVFVLMLGAVCWFAYNYGLMQAQKTHLQVQLQEMKVKSDSSQIVKEEKQVAAQVDSTQAALKEKARQDSIRMAASTKAIEMAEKADSLRKAKTNKETDSKLQKATATMEYRVVDDIRVRTGAYRIVGVAQTVTIREGQTMQSVSRRYLGPGMECYVEAINGCHEVKVGQKVKIPKLELKKKAK